MGHSEFQAGPFSPVRLLETELSQPLALVPAGASATGAPYRRALALVRLHGQPLGLVELHLAGDGLGAADLASHIWRALEHQITEHLWQDGLPEVTGLDAAGFASAATPRCLQERAARLHALPFASVIVCTQDRPELLSATLHSLTSLDYPRYETIVVDNAPRTPATASLVRDMYGDMTHVRYVREDRRGLSWARNRGIAEATGEIVAFTDDDVRVDAGWLSELVLAFGVDKDVAGTTGLVLPMEIETPAQQWFEEFGGFGKGFTRRIFDMAAHRPHSLLYPFACGMIGSGNNMAFKTSVLREMGAFDPALGAGTPSRGGEDLVAFFQLITRGFTLVYEPRAIIHHLHRRDYDGLRKQMYGYGAALTAYLTKCLLDDPRYLLQFALRVPHGLVYALSSGSQKNVKKSAIYPQELTRIERKGMLYGPLAYLRGRREARRVKHRLGPLDVHAARASANGSVPSRPLRETCRQQASVGQPRQPLERYGAVTKADTGQSHLRPLTSLRFLAALLVVLHHYMQVFPTSFLAQARGLVHACLESGFIGVPFFFVLSGFILAYTYLTADGRMRVGCRDFWVARLARIYPVYLLGFVIAAWPFFWSLRGHTSPLVSGLTVLTLTQAWLPHVTADAWNHPGWSLSDEAFFYLLFPLSAVAIVRFSRRQLYAAIGALWIASLAMACAYVAVHPDGIPWTWTARWYQLALFNPLARLPEFLMGVGFGRLFAIEAAGTGLRRATRVRNLSGALLGGLTLVVAAGALRGQQDLLYIAAHNGLLALPFGLAIYYLAYTKSHLATALSVPAVFMLGEASYAMYILHYPIGQWMAHYLAGVLDSAIMNGPIMFACYLAVVIGCSILSLHLLERPARRAIVRAFRGRTRQTTASVHLGPTTTVPTL